ncbi:MAG: CDP-diacylglycerol--glycerol-3-phosphate 3-phosphatidyltransferase [Campylobacterales bacterium]
MIKKVPNYLTSARIAVSFIILFYFIYLDVVTNEIGTFWANWVLLAIFLLGASTDFLDGYIARRVNNGVTFFGEVFDPLADKMLMLSALLGLVAVSRAPLLAVFLILAREFFITGLRVIAVKKDIKVAASSLGKWKTGLQITVVSFLMAGFLSVGEILIWIATAITLYSGYKYTKEYLG